MNPRRNTDRPVITSQEDSWASTSNNKIFRGHSLRVFLRNSCWRFRELSGDRSSSSSIVLLERNCTAAPPPVQATPAVAESLTSADHSASASKTLMSLFEAQIQSELFHQNRERKKRATSARVCLGSESSERTPPKQTKCVCSSKRRHRPLVPVETFRRR